MRTIYLKKDNGSIIRKVLIDMAFLASHKKIRLRKVLFEDGLYIEFINLNNGSNPEKYFLSKDKIKKEDEFHYFFDFPFRPEQVEGTAV